MPKAIHRVVYAVEDVEGKDDSRWTRVGVSFLNKDDSETVLLSALPVSGKLILQKPKEKPESPEA